MARRVQASGRTGWYYRVIETGVVAAGDGLELAESWRAASARQDSVRGARPAIARKAAASRRST
jgi:MOSC domain-containing protein YiiM